MYLGLLVASWEEVIDWFSFLQTLLHLYDDLDTIDHLLDELTLEHTQQTGKIKSLQEVQNWAAKH